MPSRNSIKEFAPQSFYHVYNRGVEKRRIFLDEQDYVVFLGLLKKYISGEQTDKNNRHPIKKFGPELKLIAYCLMPNHFHLLFYQENETTITEFMRRVTTGYVMYFNNRYQRVGGLFQGRYKASSINADSYLHHISRYIHLNPENYNHWPYSSLPYFLGKRNASWVQPGLVMDIFDNDPEQYRAFLRDYEDNKKELDALKWQLANNPDDLWKDGPFTFRE